jgi:hypothetical protein
MDDKPTPRTDKAIQRCACADYIIEPAFARQLERELAAAHERIRRLEDVGDMMAVWEHGTTLHSAWIKAKESKP